MKYAILVKHRYSNEFSSLKVVETELPPEKKFLGIKANICTEFSQCR